MAVMVATMVVVMSPSRRSWCCVCEEAAGHSLVLTDLESLHAGSFDSGVLFQCHTMHFRSKSCPCLEKYTVLTEFGDEKPGSASLESGFLVFLPSSEMHTVWVILWSLNFSWHQDHVEGLLSSRR